MKTNRFITLLLVFVMCASLVLASCSKVSKGDVEKDPIGENVGAVGTTVSAIGGSFSPIAEPFKAIKDSGTVEITWKNDDIGIDASGSLSYDREGSRFYGDVGAKFGDSDVAVKVFGDKNALAVEAPGLFEGAYGINFATLAEDIKNSDLFGNIDVDEIAEAVNELIEMRDKVASNDDTKLKEAFDALWEKVCAKINEAEHTVEKKNVTTGGKEVGAIVTEFKITEEDLVKVLEVVRDNGEELFNELINFVEGYYSAYYSNYGKSFEPDFDYDDVCDEIDEMIDDIDEHLEFDCDVMFALDSKTGQLIKLVFSFDNDDEKLTGEFDFGREVEEFTEITGNVTVEDDHWTQKFDIKMTRSEDSSKFSESLEFKYSYEYDSESSSSSDTVKFSISFENDKNAKTYDLKVKGSNDRSYNYDRVYESSGNGRVTRSPSDYSNDFKLTVSGALDYGSKYVTFGLDDLKLESNGRTYVDLDDFGLTVKISSDTDFESVPEFTNVMSMDMDDFEDLGDEIEDNAEDMKDDLKDLVRDLQKYFR